MSRALRGLWPCLLALAGCTDNQLTATTYVPEVRFVSHSDGAVVREGGVLEVVAEVTHGGAVPEDLLLTWKVDSEETCLEAELDEEWLSRCVLDLKLGQHWVRFEVVDHRGQVASVEIMIDLHASSPPQAIITSPDAGQAITAGVVLDFAGAVSDTEDLPSELTVWWESDLDGPLDVEAEPDERGVVEGTGTLSHGTHVLTLNVADRSGLEGRDEVEVWVDPP